MLNDIITFGIPVYNNAAMLDDTLSYLYNEFGMDDFQLLISDNCSTDNTVQVIQKYASGHKNLHYFVQEKNAGTDMNCYFLQQQCKTRYFMHLADYIRPYRKQFLEVISMLQAGDYDAVIIEDGTRLKFMDSKLYTDKNEALADLFWHMTHMSVTIYSSEIFKSKIPDYLVKHGFEFFSIVRIFNYLAEKESCKVYWHSEQCMYIPPRKKVSAWHGRFMYVWVEQYVETILALPMVYSLESKLLALKEFYEGSIILQLVTFAKYIKEKDMTSKQIYKYRKHIPYISKFDWRFLYFLSLMPKPFTVLFYIFTWVLKKGKFAITDIKKKRLSYC
jgi:glycosyltransferase involved in cell wall biosynthesis